MQDSRSAETSPAAVNMMDLGSLSPESTPNTLTPAKLRLGFCPQPESRQNSKPVESYRNLHVPIAPIPEIVHAPNVLEQVPRPDQAPTFGAMEDGRGKIMECAQWMMLRPETSKSEPTRTSSWFSSLAEAAAVNLVTSFLGGASGNRDKETPATSLCPEDEGTNASAFLSLDTALQSAAGCDLADQEGAGEVLGHGPEWLKSYSEFWYHLCCVVYSGIPATEDQAPGGTHIPPGTPEMLEFIKALDLCEALSLWSELDQHLTSKRFLQDILVWRDLLPSVNQAIEIYAVALGRSEQARINMSGEHAPLRLQMF